MGAGRTDTGVHAKEMFAHFDYTPTLEIESTLHKLNSYLPKDIAIYDIIPVHQDAHARFDAKKRTYQYHISSVKDVFSQEECWYYHQNLEVELMNQAAKILLSHTDFQCFSKVNTDVNTFNCTIYEAYWKQENNQLIFTISADRFVQLLERL
jgi:tRNA pseudouridine38-40 synthase